jgi:hypothetical protein
VTQHAHERRGPDAARDQHEGTVVVLRVDEASGRRAHEQRRAGAHGGVQGVRDQSLPLDGDLQQSRRFRRGADGVAAHVLGAVDAHANGQELTGGELETGRAGEAERPDVGRLVDDGEHRRGDEPACDGRGRQAHRPRCASRTMRVSGGPARRFRSRSHGSRPAVGDEKPSEMGSESHREPRRVHPDPGRRGEPVGTRN